MAVTEIAILHSKSGDLDASLKAKLEAAQPIQDEWHAKHFPSSPSSAGERGAAMFQQIEDPAKILLTARWDSVAAHWQWIASTENQAAMAGLQPHFAMEGDEDYDESKKMVLFHLDAEILCASAPAGLVHLLGSPVISVGRLFIEAGKKAAFVSKWEEVRKWVEEYARPHMVKAGWREDKEAEDKEEFVMVCGWESVERHVAFAQEPTYSQYPEIKELVTGADVKHFRRFQ